MFFSRGGCITTISVSYAWALFVQVLSSFMSFPLLVDVLLLCFPYPDAVVGISRREVLGFG